MTRHKFGLHKFGLRGSRIGWVLPAALVLMLVTVVPLGRVVWTSLHRSTPTTGSDFVGLSNFTHLLTTRDWWMAVATSLVVVATVVLIQVGLGVMFGAALHRVSAAWPWMRIIVLIPVALLSVVSVVTWRDAVSTGYLNYWFDLGDAGPLAQLVAVSVGEIWRGTGMVAAVVAVALARVPASLSAATLADGATGFQHWRRVVLPAIGPALAAIAAFRVFDTYRVIDGPLLADDPSASLRTAPLVTWTTEFTTLELGLGAAMSVVLVMLAGVVAALVIPLFRVRRLL